MKMRRSVQELSYPTNCIYRERENRKYTEKENMIFTTMGYYSTIKILICALPWMNLKIVLSEISQTQKTTYCIYMKCPE